MFEKNKFSFFNIFLFCVCFGLLFFVKVDSYAQTAFVVECNQNWTAPNGTSHSLYREWRFPSSDQDCRFAFYSLSYQSRYILCSNLNSSITYDYWYSADLGNAITGSTVMTFNTWHDMFGGDYYFFGGNVNNNDMDFNTGNNAVYEFGGIPIFSDLDDLAYYLEFGTMPELPFYEDIKLDKFKVICKGDWIQEFLNGKVEFNHIVAQPFWSNPDITSVEVTVYAKNPAYNYNPQNWTYSGNESGLFHEFNISGLTLHDEIFVIRATPFTSYGRGVSIQYEFPFPKDFDQPIGQLVIPTGNTYPYSTTLDISGNDVPIEWTVTQTPIYVYETNNIENYYYGEPVSYPVPVITEDTSDNYYTEYVNNYYESYETVINNYNTSFDFDFGDISSNDIQNGYDQVGNFFDGIGGVVSKVAQLFAGLFPFLSPAISVTIVAAFGLLIVIGGIVLFVKIIKAILP